MKVSTQIVLQDSANVFVVMNTALIPCKDPSFQPYTEGGRSGNQTLLNALREMAGINRKSFDGEDFLVQLWYSNDESDNITDHRLDIELDDGTYTMFLSTLDYLPYSYLKDKHEGDTIRVKIPVYLQNKETSRIIDAVWDAELTLKQDGHYRIDRFEEAVEVVVGAARQLYLGTPSHNFEFQG